MDTTARLSFSHTKGLIFGYKLKIVSINPDSAVVPLLPS
jgi:hypothetical protein